MEDVIWFDLSCFLQRITGKLRRSKSHEEQLILFQRAPVASLREQVIHRTHRNSHKRFKSDEFGEIPAA